MTLEEKEEILDIQKKKHHSPHSLCETINLLPEPRRTKELEKLLKDEMDKGGGWYTIYQISTLLNYQLTIKEMEDLAMKYVVNGDIYNALEITKVLDRNLTLGELEEMFEVHMKKNNYIVASEIANVFPFGSTQRKVRLEEVHALQKEKGHHDDARRTAELIPK